MSTKDREIVITRTMSAPRDVVFDAWTDSVHLLKWWSPKGFKMTFHQVQIKPGGVWNFDMHTPDGDDYNNKLVFKEVKRPERLVYSHGSEDEPDQFEVTVQLTQAGDKTELQMRMLYPNAKDCEMSKKFGAVQGGNSTLDRLGAYLLSTRS